MRMEILDERDGVIRVRVDSADDLWIASLLISAGDRVRGRTTRDVSIGDEKRRVPVTLTIEVIKTEFQPFTNKLRVHGVIVEGPERFGLRGAHHTISVGVGDEIVIYKREWSPELLSEILSLVRPINVLAVAVDFDEYAMALVQMQGVKVIDEKRVSLPISDESFEEEKDRLLDELSKRVMEAAARYGVDAVIIASPGTLKDELRDRLRGAGPLTVYTDTVANGGYAGIQELINRGALREVLTGTAIEKASKALEEFEYLLANNESRVAYGLAHVDIAADAGAVEKVVITDDMLGGFDVDRRRVEEILKKVAKKGGAVIIVPASSPPGERVKALGGILAILRYPLDVRWLESVT